MPYPREYLVSSRHKNVITIRASGDYSPTEENWRIGRQSLFAYAIGLLPFKDTFLTNDVRSWFGCWRWGAARSLGFAAHVASVLDDRVWAHSAHVPRFVRCYSERSRGVRRAQLAPSQTLTWWPPLLCSPAALSDRVMDWATPTRPE